MPGNVLHAAPVTAIRLWLCKSFVHERAYPQNEYKNGVDIRTPDIGAGDLPKLAASHSRKPDRGL